MFLIKLLIILSVTTIYTSINLVASSAVSSTTILPSDVTTKVTPSASTTTTTTTGTSTKHDSKVEAARTDTISTRNDDSPLQYEYKVIQVHIVHRHGDRTPITPMENEEYWAKTLPSPEILEKMAQGTKVIRLDGYVNDHAANGRGPFGKLTTLGLLQMTQVGSKLREQLVWEKDNRNEKVRIKDQFGNLHVHDGRLFTPSNPFHPSKVSVSSTDFLRTVQSVQALLVGLMEDCESESENDDWISASASSSGKKNMIHIDARHTNVMIPDPIPRLSQEQIDLERKLSDREHLRQKENELSELAIRVTNQLRPILGDDALSVSFGISDDNENENNKKDNDDDDDDDDDKGTKQRKALSWTQLAEITKCLKIRNMLPNTITNEDYNRIKEHAAWTWFETLRHERLSQLSMGHFLKKIVNRLHIGTKIIGICDDGRTESNENHKPLHIYSGHDSSLIGLMCAFKLEQPKQWPEYGSYLKIELVEAKPVHPNNDNDHDHNTIVDKEFFVRFSLNGTVLRCGWGVGSEHYPEAMDMISLEHLIYSIEQTYNEAVLLSPSE